MLCTFCPCKNGNKVKRAATPRERKETGSQPHCGAPKVGVLYKSFRRHSLNFFRKNLTKRRCEGRWCEAPEGIRRSVPPQTYNPSVCPSDSQLPLHKGAKLRAERCAVSPRKVRGGIPAGFYIPPIKNTPFGRANPALPKGEILSLFLLF